MELSIQERLKDLRVERGLTLEQLAEQTHLSKSALGSYEGDNFKDISHYALIELAKFYEVTVDYLLGRSQTKNHPNADLADLRLSDDMIELLKSGLWIIPSCVSWRYTRIFPGSWLTLKSM